MKDEKPAEAPHKSQEPVKPDPEAQRLLLEKTKEIYKRLPKQKGQVLESRINFSALTELNLFERVIRQWVTSRIKALLGVEEQAMINLVVGHLKTCKASPDTLMAKVGGILDEDSEEFVFKLWQALLFEHLKVEGGIYGPVSSIKNEDVEMI